MASLRARLLLMAACLLAGPVPQAARAQSYAIDPAEDLSVETVTVTIVNPSPDEALNSRITDAVRQSLALFPGARFSADRADFAIAAARRNPAIANIAYDLTPGVRAGVDVAVAVTLSDSTHPALGRGWLITGEAQDFPVLYDRNGTLLRFKLEALSMAYGNVNAWYGQPDPMLAGNPLVQGQAPGARATCTTVFTA